MTQELEQQFARLHSQYRGLTPSVLVRMLLADQLQRSDTELDRIIQAAIRGERTPSPPVRFGANTRRTNRVSERQQPDWVRRSSYANRRLL
jgi:hypothetical protein